MVNLVFGCGYLGERVAHRWIAAGHEVWATTRSSERAAQLAGHGIRPIVVDLARPFVLPREMPTLDTVLSAVGFDRSSGQSIQEVYVGGMRNLLQALPPTVQRFIYISSTGVYGQSQGESVDEQSPCEPSRPSGQACLAAERLLAEHGLASRQIVLRLAGIYGPQRVPKLAAVRAGTAVEASAAGLLNLIHVEDAVEVVLAAEQHATPPALYVVSDGQPVMRGDFYRELARLLTAPQPRFTDPGSNSSSADRSASAKRICSDRLRNDLGVPLKFPSYREGLASIVSELTSS